MLLCHVDAAWLMQLAMPAVQPRLAHTLSFSIVETSCPSDTKTVQPSKGTGRFWDIGQWRHTATGALDKLVTLQHIMPALLYYTLCATSAHCTCHSVHLVLLCVAGKRVSGSPSA